MISVNWSAGSATAEYFLIQSRVRTVGAEVGEFLMFLQDATGLTTHQIHVIGHSLGAHAAGFVGKSLNGTLPRITGRLVRTCGVYCSRAPCSCGLQCYWVRDGDAEEAE